LRTSGGSDAYLDPAADLLAERHRRHRAAEPLLAETDAREALERAWRRDGASGSVALRGGEVVGYHGSSSPAIAGTSAK
jgi:hypothetical protein